MMGAEHSFRQQMDAQARAVCFDSLAPLVALKHVAGLSWLHTMTEHN